MGRRREDYYRVQKQILEVYKYTKSQSAADPPAKVWVLMVTSLLMLAAESHAVLEASEWIALVGLVLGGGRIGARAAVQLQYCTIGMDGLVAIALLGCIVLGFIGEREVCARRQGAGIGGGYEGCYTVCARSHRVT